VCVCVCVCVCVQCSMCITSKEHNLKSKLGLSTFTFENYPKKMQNTLAYFCHAVSDEEKKMFYNFDFRKKMIEERKRMMKEKQQQQQNAGEDEIVEMFVSS
jgi:hypothetical protein